MNKSADAGTQHEQCSGYPDIDFIHIYYTNNPAPSGLFCFYGARINWVLF